MYKLTGGNYYIMHFYFPYTVRVNFYKPAWRLILFAVIFACALLYAVVCVAQEYEYEYSYAVSFTHPLVAAADQNNLKKVRVLLERGSNPNARAEFGATAIMRAAFNGNQEMVELLLGYGANPGVQDIGLVDAVKIAKRSNNLEIFNILQAITGKNYSGAPPSTILASTAPKDAAESLVFIGPVLALQQNNSSMVAEEHLKEVDELYATKTVQKLQLKDAKKPSDIQNKNSEHVQYVTQLYEDFYSLDKDFTKAYKLTSGVYIIQASHPNSLQEEGQRNNDNSIKLTEAVEISSIMNNKDAIYTNYVIYGFMSEEDIHEKFTPQIAQFYFNNSKFERNYDQLTIQLHNKFSPYQGKKACARLTRRFRTLKCEVY